MAVYQTIRLGRLTMREDFSVSETSDSQVSLTGKESMGVMGQRTRLQVEQRRDDVLSLVGELVAVRFTEKSNLDGFYVVQESQADLTNWDDEWAILNWSANLFKIGPDTEVDIESRLSGAITRTNDFSVIGSRVHAPAGGAKAYWSGVTTPIYVDRVGSEGTIRAYRDLTQGINPRWAVGVENYENGRVRFIDHNGLERVGTSFHTDAGDWELHNSLVRLRPGTATASTFSLDVWAAGAWVSKTWDITYNTGPTVTVGEFDYVTVLDNTYESVTIRLTKDLAPGRMTVDLTLRRGMTFVEMYIQHQFSTTLVVKRSVATAGTGSPGYIAETAADANGMKTIVGSARTFTGDNPTMAVSKAATATLDAFIGVSMSSGAGNVPADVQKQYLGAPAELVRGVRR